MGLYSENLKTSPRREYVFAAARRSYNGFYNRCRIFSPRRESFIAAARKFHKKLLGHGILLAAAEYISSRGDIISPRREMTIAAATVFYNTYKKRCRMLRRGEV